MHMTPTNGLKLGTTIFSFNNEYHSRRYSLEQLIAKVGELGLGPGLEIVGFSHVRGFPVVTDEFAQHFRLLLDRHKLQASCIGLNADAYIRRNQRMTDDESYAYHEGQVRAAAKLGFPVARYQFLAGPEVIRRLAPLAEKLNVKLGLEIHAPERPNSRDVLAYREMYARVNSPYLGFIPDMGASAKGVPPSLVKWLREIGIQEKFIQIALDCWAREGSREERAAEYRKQEQAAGASEMDIRKMFMMFSMIGRMEPRGWLEIMPQVIHIHGKCYDFDANNHEPAIPYEELLPVFQNAGYQGFMSTEWEGQAFNDEDGFAKVQAHHALAKRILGRA
jgi:sugar phosphate isomerase/epimerase